MNNILATDQLAFLRSNFVLYQDGKENDAKCFADSNLLFLIDDSSSAVMHDVKSQFFNMFEWKKNSCFISSMTPNFQKARLVARTALCADFPPDLMIVPDGSWKNFKEQKQIKKTITQLQEQCQKCIGGKVRQIANILNREVGQMRKVKYSIKVSSEVRDQIQRIDQEICLLNLEFGDKITQLKARVEKKVEDPVGETFAEQLVQATSRYQKTIVSLDYEKIGLFRNLYGVLEKRKIQCLFMVPSQRLRKRIKEEKRYARETEQCFRFALQGHYTSSEIFIPLSYASFFDERIRKIVKLD